MSENRDMGMENADTKMVECTKVIGLRTRDMVLARWPKLMEITTKAISSKIRDRVKAR